LPGQQLRWPGLYGSLQHRQFPELAVLRAPHPRPADRTMPGQQWQESRHGELRRNLHNRFPALECTTESGVNILRIAEVANCPNVAARSWSRSGASKWAKRAFSSVTPLFRRAGTMLRRQEFRNLPARSGNLASSKLQKQCRPSSKSHQPPAPGGLSSAIEASKRKTRAEAAQGY
jgi:glutathione S-transferase